MPGDSYLGVWRARAQADEARATAWRAQRLIAQPAGLVEQLGLARVRLFGSLARGSAAPESDVDLWVEGLAEEDFFGAERARLLVKKRALREGMVMHER